MAHSSRARSQGASQRIGEPKEFDATRWYVPAQQLANACAGQTGCGLHPPWRRRSRAHDDVLRRLSEWRSPKGGSHEH